MIALVQPFGLQDGSGGGRILRALVEEAPAPFVSVCLSAKPPAPTQLGREVHVPWRRHLGRWEERRGFRHLKHLIQPRSVAEMEAALVRVFEAEGVDLVHAIPHGWGFWCAYRAARTLGIPYVLNVHDDLRYNLAGSPHLAELMRAFALVWQAADARIVISDAMGEAYRMAYGGGSYVTVTDGYAGALRSEARPALEGRFHVYFMGALHLSYHPNFDVLRAALERLHTSGPDLGVRLTARGSALPFGRAGFPFTNLPYAPEDVVAQDFAQADVLYFPLPFGEAYAPFVRYSLSTKLVTYVRTGVPILYHGPEASAAWDLLRRYEAAVPVHTLDPAALREGFRQVQQARGEVVQGALRLAREQFRLDDQRRRFWSLLEAVAAGGDPATAGIAASLAPSNG